MVDFSTELGRRVLGLLDSEQVIWMTTVDSKGAPQPRPVWFLWDGSSLLIYSRPDAYKLRHLVRNARVSLNFNSDPEAHQVAVLVGEARVDPDAPRADRESRYLEKYGEGIAGLGMTPESFGAAFSVAVRVTPERLRGL